MKVCPTDRQDKNDNFGCGEKLHASVRVCTCCDFEFDIDDSPKISANAADVPIMTMAEPDSRTVTSRTFRFHEGKGDKPPSVKVTYMSGMTAINEWLCPEHKGFAKSKADRYWREHGGNTPFPREVLEWIERQSELKETAEIMVKPRDRYWDVVSYVVGEHVAANDNDEAPANDNRPHYEDWDDIPF